MASQKAHRAPPPPRHAMLGAVDQAATMQAVAGNDPADWHDKIGQFGPEMPLANDAGIEVMTSPRDYDRVRRDVTAAGYRGEPIVFLDPSDIYELHAVCLMGIDMLRRAAAARAEGRIGGRRKKRRPRPRDQIRSCATARSLLV